MVIEHSVSRVVVSEFHKIDKQSSFVAKVDFWVRISNFGISVMLKVQEVLLDGTRFPLETEKVDNGGAATTLVEYTISDR